MLTHGAVEYQPSFFVSVNFFITMEALSKSALYSLLSSSKFEENVANDDWLS